jgi:hypothetical protein
MMTLRKTCGQRDAAAEKSKLPEQDQNKSLGGLVAVNLIAIILYRNKLPKNRKQQILRTLNDLITQNLAIDSIRKMASLSVNPIRYTVQ